jgi:hypothetical protein
VIRANGLPLQRTQASLTSRSNAQPCTTRTLQRWLGRHGISAARSPSLPRPLRCSRSRICSRAAAMIRRCRTSTRPSNISLRRQDRLAPSVGPNRNLADWLHLHAFPAARYSSKPQRPHCRDTTPRRPLPSRNPHEISCRDVPRVIAAVLQRHPAPDIVSW